MEKLTATVCNDASVIRNSINKSEAEAHGKYYARCLDKDGNVKWEEDFSNLVTIPGKNLALDTFLAGSNYTVTGPYIGLVSSVGYSSFSIDNTMGTHSGWFECSGSYTPNVAARGTVAWNSASSGSKTMSAATSFSITTGGDCIGCFLVYGSGAVTTIGNTGGTLYSAGSFAGGTKTVASSDTLQVSFTSSL